MRKQGLSQQRKEDKQVPARSRTTSSKKTETARVKLTEWAEESSAADKAATRLRHRMYAGMLKGFNAGLTYNEIAEITGLSSIRVSQVLAEYRSKNGQ